MKSLLLKLFPALVVMFLLWMILPAPPIFRGGTYNTFTRLSSCRTNEYNCMHEKGHAIDQYLGWASKTPEFHNAVSNYIQLYTGHVFANEIEKFGLGDMKELYAWMYVWADAQEQNMPQEFRQFYDWEFSSRLSNREPIAELIWPIYTYSPYIK